MHRLACLLALLALPALAQPNGMRATGDAWRALDEFHAALAAFDAGLAARPGDATLLAERAITLHRLGQLVEARAAIEAAVAAAGLRDAYPYAARAGLALLARDDAAAAADLAEAQRRAPGDARIATLSAVLAARQGTAPAPDVTALDALRRVFGPWLAP
jgi:Flp pilus assembly protein TadD